ncbi:MAG: hypothetical protein Q9226_002908 [Calogaya cf. arnoldii]
MATERQDTIGPLELHCPQDPVVDICFVHGILGGNISTCCLKDKGLCWPRDLLPRDLPVARILSFGYDADIAQFWSKALLDAQNGVKGSDRAIEEFAHVVDFERRLLNLSTQDTNQELLKEIQDNSYQLKEISEKFPQWLRKRGGKKETSVGIVFFTGELATGKIGKIVTDEPAHIQGYRSSLSTPITRICAFSGQDDAKYQRVLIVLREWVKDLEERKTKKPQEASSNVKTTFSGANYGGLNAGQFNHTGSGGMSFGYSVKAADLT